MPVMELIRYVVLSSEVLRMHESTRKIDYDDGDYVYGGIFLAP